MSASSPDQIRRLAELIAREIVATSGHESAQEPSAMGTSLGGGVFSKLDDAVAAASAAFRGLDVLGLEKRHALIESMREAMRQNARPLAALAVEETGLGRVEDKVQKNLLVTNKTPGPEELTPQATSGDHGLALIEPAPFGVIGAITPVTNPSSTIICNSIGMVAAGNTVVFNPHPSAKRVSPETVRLLNAAIVKAGGPPNTVACTAEPTIESAGELMKHPRIRLLVVTGGGAVVAAAMNSGKRAICAGPGNPPAIVDETADLEKAGRDIVFGHSFDNNVICTDEKEVIAVDSIADALKEAMTRAGAFELPAGELPRLEKVIFEKGAGPRGHAVVNKKYIGKDASVILQGAGHHGGARGADGSRGGAERAPSHLDRADDAGPAAHAREERGRRDRPRRRGRGSMLPHRRHALARHRGPLDDGAPLQLLDLREERTEPGRPRVRGRGPHLVHDRVAHRRGDDEPALLLPLAPLHARRPFPDRVT